MFALMLYKVKVHTGALELKYPVTLIVGHWVAFEG